MTSLLLLLLLLHTLESLENLVQLVWRHVVAHGFEAAAHGIAAAQLTEGQACGGGGRARLDVREAEVRV